MGFIRIKYLILMGFFVGLAGIFFAVLFRHFTGNSMPSYAVIAVVSVVCGILAAKNYSKSGKQYK